MEEIIAKTNIVLKLKTDNFQFPLLWRGVGVRPCGA
jgi:hypothetical protein